MKPNILRLSTFLMVTCFSSVHLEVNAEESVQKCGDSITWEYNDGTLTLTGSGEMYDFTSAGAPWSSIAENIHNIQIAEGITSIGKYAFCDCQPSSLNIPDSITVIGEYACSNMQSLKDIKFSAQLSSIGNYAFYQCPRLNAAILPDGLKTIGERCFSMDYELQTVKVPTSVTYIGDSVFAGSAAWYRAQTDEFVILGDGILYAYLGDDTQVIVPDTVSQICGNAFCSQIYVPFSFNNQASEMVILNPNTKITTVELPNSIRSIPNALFEGMTNLQRVVLPDALISIGEKAFSGCTALSELNIPQSVTDIGEYAFSGSLWLKNAGDYVIVGDGILYSFQGRQKILTIPQTVKKICFYAVKGDQIMEVICPPSVAEIQSGGIQGKNITIIGTPDTAAEIFAKKNNIPFRNINNQELHGDDMTLDYQKDGWAFGNSGEVFGKDYYLTAEDRQHLTALGIDTDNEQNWEGSCVGLATTVILAKNHVFTPNQLQSGAGSLSEVTPTDAVVSMINYYQCTQNRAAASATNESDVQRFYRMTQVAKNIKYGESPFLLTFALASGSHGVVGYGQEAGEWEFGGRTYDARILVWDSNFPNELRDDACLYYDSATFDYTIPYYGVVYAENASGNVGGIITVCNDLSVLNAYPYAFSQTPLTGDLDENGEVNVKDAVILARLVTNDTSLEISEAAKANADINGDGVVSTVDLTTLLRVLAKSEFQQ